MGLLFLAFSVPIALVPVFLLADAYEHTYGYGDPGFLPCLCPFWPVVPLCEHVERSSAVLRGTLLAR